MNTHLGDKFNTFGQMLRFLRLREHMTQRELARAVGYSDAQIARLENGLRSPDPDVVAARFVEALHLQDQPDIAANLIALAQQPSSAQDAVEQLDTSPDQHNDPPEGSTGAKHNLTTPITTLIGRENDVQRLISLLQRQDVRLVTLLGAPGVGKTRLAMHVALGTKGDYADGAWFVPLASVNEPETIAPFIAQELGLSFGNIPPQIALKQHLKGKRMLLVLDNLEQLLSDDNAAGHIHLISDLLTSAPGLKIITTSRAALHISGENLFDVPALSDEASQILFVQRAQAVKADFRLNDSNRQVVIDICQRLDHLPLAIELAAARARLFDPNQLLARLSTRLSLLTDGARDLPSRQRTLRNTIDWSYNLLSPDEQTLFRRLGIFMGGCTLDAAVQVAGAGLHAPVLDLLGSLADKSLIKIDVETDVTRVALLEMLREYALERLLAHDEMEIMASRHAEYYVAEAETITPLWTNQSWARWQAFIQKDENLLAALTYARRADRDDLLVRIVPLAFVSSTLHHSIFEGDLSWLLKLTARARTNQPRQLFGRFLVTSAWMMSSYFHEFPLLTLLEDALSILEASEDTLGTSWTHLHLGTLLWIQGEFPQSKMHLDAALQQFRALNNEYGVVSVQEWQAALERDQGNFDRAGQLFEQNCEWAINNSDWNRLCNLLHGMGEYAYYQGDLAASNYYYEEAYKTGHKLVGIDAAHPWRGLSGLAHLAYLKGNLEESDRMYTQAIEGTVELHQDSYLTFTLHHAGFVKHLLGDEAGAADLMKQALHLQYRPPFLTIRLWLAESLDRFAWIAADKNQPQRAARLLGAAHNLRKQFGIVFPEGDRPLYDRYLAMAHNAMDSDAFGQAWSEGVEMSLGETVSCALENM